MPANIQQVSFQDPRLLYAPDSVVQQQQIQRQQQLADALRAQSQADMPAAPGSHVSWTQGAAKVVAALLAKQQYKKIDQGNTALAQQYAAALRGQFGGGRAQPPAPTQSQPAPETLALPATGQNINIPAPNQPPQADAGPAPALPPGGGAGPAPRGPWSLSGNQQQDMNDYMLNPEKYGEAVISSHAPVDMSKMVRQAQEAASNGDYATAAALYGNIEKQNNIPLQPGRPGAPMFDHTGKIVAMAPQNVEGGNPVIEDGKFTGSYTQAPGVTGVVQNVAAAKATGTAAGDLVDVYNPATHQMEKVPKSVALSGAANGQTPFSAGPPLGATKAFDVTGQNSANAFQDISNGAADVPNRIYALKQMQAITVDPTSQFGAGSNGLNHFNSLLGTLSHSTGISFDPKAATNANEFQKWATQYSARSGQELGLSGSDARTQLAVHATPNGEMTRQALQSVIPQMIGIENAKQGYAAAANMWQQQRGPQDVQNFRTAWNKVYNPSIYTHMAQGPQSFAGWVKTLNPQQAAQVRGQYVALKQLGALPQ
jgi:hypothetical protein